MQSQIVLRQEIQRLLKSTSAKAFCIDTGLHPTALSQFLSGKRVIMKQAATKYFRRMLTDEAWKRVLSEYEIEVNGTRPLVVPVTEVAGQRVQTEDQFHYQANPMHSAIIVLMEAKDCDGTAAYFAKKLNVSLAEAEAWLERLVRLELLVKDDNRYCKTGRRCALYVEEGGRESLVLRRKAILEILAVANQKERGDDRHPITYCFAEFTVAIDPSNMPELITEMRALFKKFDRVTLRSEAKEAYIFSMALAPMARPRAKS